MQFENLYKINNGPYIVGKPVIDQYIVPYQIRNNTPSNLSFNEIGNKYYPAALYEPNVTPIGSSHIIIYQKDTNNAVTVYVF